MMKKLCRICTMAIGIFAFVLMCGISVSAKEVTVSGQNIQAALDTAKDASENVTVIIPAGNYTLNHSLLVYSNTTIQADGANITVVGSQPVLTQAQNSNPVNIVVTGGSWRAEADKVVYFINCSDIVLNNMVICGSDASKGIWLENAKSSKVSGCEIDGAGIAIKLYKCEQTEVSDNKITNSAEDGIRAERVSNLKVIGNIINQSGKYGIWLDWDTASSIKGNKLNGCAVDHSLAGHGEGLVIQHGEGTWIEENEVSNVHSYIENYGNGIIVSNSNNITVARNTVNNAGNHGMQATYESNHIFFNDNVVNNSGNMGISVSRASSADLTGNRISNSARSGIAYDGKIYNGKEGVSGTVTGCTVDGSRGDGIHLELSDVTFRDTRITNSTGYGVTILSSNANLKNCVISQDTVNQSGYGIVTNNGAVVTLEGNRICNFGNSGIVLNSGCTMTGTNNQIMVNANKFNSNAIYTDKGNATGIVNNSLFIKSISATEVTGQNYYKGFNCGVVVNGVEYTSQTGNGGMFTVGYPSIDSSRVIVYVKDDAGNAICLQAPPDFDLNNIQGDNPAFDTERAETFVRRMYRIVLNRENVSSSELEYYLTRLRSGEMDGSSLAQGFVGSSEFQNKQLSEEEYLKALYSAFFNRVPSSPEIQFYKDMMASGKSRKDVLQCFVNSNEFLGLCEEAGITRGQMVVTDMENLIWRMYERFLDRKGVTVGELEYYLNALQSGAMDGTALALGFYGSPEFQNKRLSEEAYLNTLYRAFFGRTPGASEVRYWKDEMASGKSRKYVLSGFVNSPEYEKLCQKAGINRGFMVLSESEKYGQ